MGSTLKVFALSKSSSLPHENPQVHSIPRLCTKQQTACGTNPSGKKKTKTKKKAKNTKHNTFVYAGLLQRGSFLAQCMVTSEKEVQSLHNYHKADWERHFYTMATLAHDVTGASSSSVFVVLHVSGPKPACPLLFSFPFAPSPPCGDIKQFQRTLQDVDVKPGRL